MITSDGGVGRKLQNSRLPTNGVTSVICNLASRTHTHTRTHTAPPNALKAASISSRRSFPRSNMNIGGIVFPLEQQSRDEESVVYHALYDTEGVPHTKSGDRQPVQVTMEFIKAGTFETVWQAKYYNYYKREHCQLGNKFSSIEYECKPNETRTLMWINKEAFN
ncbi:CB1 cannabinoid receptor-interacting protein 1a isoform X1 [Pseudoliparis swirei]|uniref:CB1 cannabinoid receptor-interacting protein 1a isoform X1 n=1 Tax=Pseudoliparis swirei TaxID=2059687 RepID=UPI0024BDEA8A|nr:CB1 cannabinoid receptor-interacting protein 1a isoform X1 [Pseudoliparis swirei]